jgi:hypothetical protein
MTFVLLGAGTVCDDSNIVPILAMYDVNTGWKSHIFVAA